MGEQTESQRVDGQGLDIVAALLAHLQWKQRLQGYIAGTSEEVLDAEMVACDRSCSLGQWIHGEGGEAYGGAEKFIGLRVTHEAFHRHAAEVVRAVHRGEPREAQRLLTQGEYSRCSNRIKSMLAGLSLRFHFD